MNIAQAKQIPLELVLAAIGAEETRRDDQRGVIWYKSPIRAGDNDASFKVNIKENIFYDFGTGKYGDVINLVREHRPGSVSDALQWLKQFAGQLTPVAIERPPSDQRSPVQRPPAQEQPRYKLTKEKVLHHPGMLAYINGRGIPAELARQYCKEVYYKHIDDKPDDKARFGVGFANDAGGFEARAIQGDFKACIGHKAVTTIPYSGDNSRATALHCFEGFFDFLTFARLIPPHQGAAVLVLNSTTLYQRGIEAVRTKSGLEDVEKVYTWFDHNPAGRKATQAYADELGSRYSVRDMSAHYDGHEDLNAYWISRKGQRPAWAPNPTPTLQQLDLGVEGTKLTSKNLRREGV
jgi:hypothetical protein